MHQYKEFKKNKIKLLHPVILTADFLLWQITCKEQQDQRPGMPSHKPWLIQRDSECGCN